MTNNNNHPITSPPEQVAKITTCVDISLEDLCSELIELNHEQLAKFVKTLDALCADWSFTRMMFEYFESEMQKEKEDDL